MIDFIAPAETDKERAGQRPLSDQAQQGDRNLLPRRGYRHCEKAAELRRFRREFCGL